MGGYILAGQVGVKLRSCRNHWSSTCVTCLDAVWEQCLSGCYQPGSIINSHERKNLPHAKTRVDGQRQVLRCLGGRCEGGTIKITTGPVSTSPFVALFILFTVSAASYTCPAAREKWFGVWALDLNNQIKKLQCLRQGDAMEQGTGNSGWVCVCERQKEKERKRERERQIGRQTDRHTHTHRRSRWHQCGQRTDPGLHEQEAGSRTGNSLEQQLHQLQPPHTLRWVNLQIKNALLHAHLIPLLHTP